MHRSVDNVCYSWTVNSLSCSSARRRSGGLMDNHRCMGVTLVTRVTLLPRCHARQVSRVTCHVAATHRGTNLWPASLQLQHSFYVLVMKLKWFQGCCYITLRHWGFVICNVKCSARCNLRRKECKNDLHKNRVVTRVLCRGNPAWHHISSHWHYTQKPYAHILEIKDVILNVCPQSLL